MKKPTVICLTPVKNEQWILDRFLKCASLWADHIIVADQNSDDRSREIALRFAKVILIQNSGPDYHEYARQKMLIDAARQLPPPRLLIALDADEFLTANFLTSPEWAAITTAPEGTVIRFQWANILPDMRHYWTPSSDLPLGFVDDGSPHKGEAIHTARIPLPTGAPVIRLRDIRVMHYQYTDWERMRSKHRWYMAWERLRAPAAKAVNLYRQYHHMDAIRKEDIQPVPGSWIKRYQEQGIDMTTVCRDRPYYWDKEVLKMLEAYGTRLFAKDQIWDVDWPLMAKRCGYSDEAASGFGDPRSIGRKIIHRYLRGTQLYSQSWFIRKIDGLIDRCAVRD